MAEIARKFQKIFGKNAQPEDLTVIGSTINGSTQASADIETLQSLSNFESGLKALVTNTQAPYLQDQNSLFYIITSQLAYLFQAGIPEWNSATEYFTGKSYVNYNGNIYVAIQDSTNKNPSSEPTYWSTVALPNSITDLSSTSKTLSLQSNTDYFLGTLTSLTISSFENSPLESTIYFTTGSSFSFTASSLSGRWVGTVGSPIFLSNTEYIISIKNGIAVAVSVGA